MKPESIVRKLKEVVKAPKESKKSPGSKTRKKRSHSRSRSRSRSISAEWTNIPKKKQKKSRGSIRDDEPSTSGTTAKTRDEKEKKEEKKKEEQKEDRRDSESESNLCLPPPPPGAITIRSARGDSPPQEVEETRSQKLAVNFTLTSRFMKSIPVSEIRLARSTMELMKLKETRVSYGDSPGDHVPSTDSAPL